MYFTSKSEDEELEEEVACQISPVFNSEGEISNQEYEFTFIGKKKTVPRSFFFMHVNINKKKVTMDYM